MLRYWSFLFILQKGVCETIHQKVLQVINQNIYGFLFMGLQRKVLLCILQCLKLGCCHYVQKIFQIIIQNIYGFAEKGFYNPEYNATIHLLDNPDT